ncbi:unnamed protein product [Scytosiphon promiscuus]
MLKISLRNHPVIAVRAHQPRLAVAPQGPLAPKNRAASDTRSRRWMQLVPWGTVLFSAVWIVPHTRKEVAVRGGQKPPTSFGLSFCPRLSHLMTDEGLTCPNKEGAQRSMLGARCPY